MQIHQFSVHGRVWETICARLLDAFIKKMIYIAYESCDMRHMICAVNSSNLRLSHTSLRWMQDADPWRSVWYILIRVHLQIGSEDTVYWKIP